MYVNTTGKLHITGELKREWPFMQIYGGRPQLHTVKLLFKVPS